MHTVRKRILEILKESGESTVAELAVGLEMAPVSVRHHLDILQGDNLICVDRLARKGNVGRPQQVYSLTEEANEYFPNNFAGLAIKLVQQVKHVLPPEQVACAFQSMAHEIASELETPESDDSSIETRLERVTEFLTERGYLARWEACGDDGEETYLLHKHNCPYAGVSSEHPELCLMDQTLINDLVGQPCQRTDSMVENGRCCTYRVGASALMLTAQA
ncbi:MAG: ArsR family transcriptional regulator [Caldilineaceae bacterium]|nr:ArsR family transcriptional regulator [Caldilineaceae bacterium]